MQERYFQKDAAKVAIAMGAVVSCLTLALAANTYHIYFQKWATAPAIGLEYRPEWTKLALSLNAQPSATDVVYLIPVMREVEYISEYLYQGVAPVHVIFRDQPDLAQTLYSTLASIENVATVKVVAWNTNDALIEDDILPFDFLLRKYGSYLGSEEYADLRVYNYVDISLAHPWTFYDHLEPLKVLYDGGISLHGLALGQGDEQLSIQRLLNLGQDSSLWGVLQWQASPGLAIDYAISLRLYNAAGERAYQADDVLWKPAKHTPTSQWSADELVDTLVQLEIPG